MNLTGGRFIHSELRLNAINFDELINDLIDDGFIGYVSLRADDREFKLIFDSGEFLGMTSDGEPVMDGSEATCGLPRQGGSGFIDVVEIPKRLARMIWDISIGVNLTGKIPTDIVDLNGLLSKYKGKFAYGVLTLYKNGFPQAFMSFEHDKWQFETPKEELLRLYEEKGVTLALFSLDKVKFHGSVAKLQKVLIYMNEPADYGLEDLIQRLKEHYPQAKQPLADLVKREFKGPKDLESVLKKLKEYIKLFVDGDIDNDFIEILRDAVIRKI